MDDRYMQKIEALHAAVAQGSLREVQAMLGRAKLALSKVNYRIRGTFYWPKNSQQCAIYEP